MLADIDKQTVDFMPNFDGTTEEPVVLPSRFPNLLVNGSEGIAPAWATNIPPHNLGEVIDGADSADRPARSRGGRALPSGQRARFSHRRFDRRPQRYSGCIPHRPRLRHHARPRGDRANRQWQAPPDRQGTPLPGQQGQADRTDRRSIAREGPSTGLPSCATNPTAKACAWSSRPAAMSIRTSS